MRCRASRRIGMSTAIRRERRSFRMGWRSCSTIRRYGGSPRPAARSGISTARIALAPHADGATAEDAGEVLAGRVIELMRATAMPNGLAALGFDERACRRARDRRRAAVSRDPQCAEGRRARRSRSAVPLGAQLLVTVAVSLAATSAAGDARHARRGQDRCERAPLAGLALDRRARPGGASRTWLTIARPKPVPPVARERLRSTR